MKDLEAQENDERLDTMLKAEGVAGPDDSLLRIQEAAGTDQYEYRQQLLKVRRELENETKAFDKVRSSHISPTNIQISALQKVV